MAQFSIDEVTSPASAAGSIRVADAKTLSLPSTDSSAWVHGASVRAEPHDSRTAHSQNGIQRVRRWLGRVLVVSAIAVTGLRFGFAPNATEFPFILALLLCGAGLIGGLDRRSFRLALDDFRLRHNNALMRHVVENSFDGVLTIDEAGVIETANAAAERIFGYAPGGLTKCWIENLIPGLVTRDGNVDREIVLATNGPREVCAQREDGGGISVDLVISEMVTDERRLFVAVLRDITERKTRQDRLVHLALHDALTGLPNRSLLEDRIQRVLADDPNQSRPAALLLLDLDHFKEINDTLGHHIGDALLIEVGQRFAATLGESVTVARLGGDEFAVLVPDIDDAGAADEVGQRLVEALRAPFSIDGMALEVAVSIGIALYPEHGTSSCRLLRCADIAMYIAKGGRNRIACYDHERDQYSVRHLAMSGDLRRAIEDDKLALHYQPKLDLASGQVVGAEALVRWRHPEHGFIAPEKFIEIAEKMGLMGALNEWIMSTALRQVAAWHRAGIDLGVSVNLSPRCLHEENLPQNVVRLLETFGVAPRYLTLEITESAIVIDPAYALEVIKRLNDIGVRLSIDDFGTGYSSLSYLNRLPVNELKIDRSFVGKMHTNGNDSAIVCSTIDLAHNLGLKVVAEGIETPSQFRQLKALGCDVGQGCYVSAPLPLEEFIDWLDEASWQVGDVPSTPSADAAYSLPEVACWPMRRHGGRPWVPQARIGRLQIVNIA